MITFKKFLVEKIVGNTALEGADDREMQSDDEFLKKNNFKKINDRNKIDIKRHQDEDGDWWEIEEFDDNGNVIHYKDNLQGGESWNTYDNNNNLLTSKGDGFESEYEYHSNNVQKYSKITENNITSEAWYNRLAEPIKVSTLENNIYKVEEKFDYEWKTTLEKNIKTGEFKETIHRSNGTPYKKIEKVGKKYSEHKINSPGYYILMYEDDGNGNIIKVSEDWPHRIEYEKKGNDTYLHKWVDECHIIYLNGVIFEKYDSLGRIIYKKEGKDVYDYNYFGDNHNSVVEIYLNGKFLNLEDTVGNEIKVDNYSASKRAEEYNRIFNGCFIHTFGNVDQLISTYKIKADVCASTIRSNAVFNFPNREGIIIGFSEFSNLYNFDAYSGIRKDKTRFATANTDDGTGIFDFEKHKNKNFAFGDDSGFDEKKYYDEGFVDISKSRILILVFNEESLSNNGKKYKSEFEKIKKNINKDIKVITFSKFKELLLNDELYKFALEQEKIQNDKKINEVPLNKYEEKKMVTFKKFLVEKFVGNA